MAHYREAMGTGLVYPADHELDKNGESSPSHQRQITHAILLNPPLSAANNDGSSPGQRLDAFQLRTAGTIYLGASHATVRTMADFKGICQRLPPCSKVSP